jgi:transcriptional regulator with GAF, ATPase, and Fis domain
MALAKAQSCEVPVAVVEAQWTLSRLTAGPRETEASRLFHAFFEDNRSLDAVLGQWDRAARDADVRLLEAAGQDKRRRDAELLASIVGRVASDADLSRSLDELYQSLRTLMASDVFGIALWAPEQKALDYALFIEEGRRTRVGLIPVDSTRSLGAWCFRSQKAVRINDIDREYGGYLKELSRLADHRPKSMLFQPLLAEGRALGIVTVQSFARDAYGSEDEANLAVIAACVSLRIQVGSLSPG